jgi:hypothetical protein
MFSFQKKKGEFNKKIGWFYREIEGNLAVLQLLRKAIKRNAFVVLRVLESLWQKEALYF